MIGVFVFAALTIAAPAIQLFKFRVAPYRDFWWHVSASDEFSRTGEFAKDPFYEDAPPFTNFGLIDLVNGFAARTLECQARTVCGITFLLGEVIFLVLAFWIGLSAGGDSVAGGLSVLACWTFSRIIFPYHLALILVYLLYISFWGPNNSVGRLAIGNWCETGLWGATWRGVCLGLAFAIHPFVGAFAAFVLAISLMVTFMSERKPAKITLFFLGAFIVAAPWILFQVRLRPLLGAHNEHNLIPAVESWASKSAYTPLLYWIVLYAFLIGTTVLRRSLEWRAYVFLGLGLLATYIPLIFHQLTSLTSIYFPTRIPLFFPYGIVAAMIPLGVGWLWKSGKRLLCVVPILAFAVLVIAYGYRRIRVEAYRFFQSEAGTPYDYLVGELGSDWHGRRVLSDPVTSYFARGMIGCYVIAVPAGDASALAPHTARVQIAIDALRDGPSVIKKAGLSVDAVLLDKKRAYLPEYFGEYAAFADFQVLDYRRVESVWGRQGWHKMMETSNCILLTQDKEQP